MSVLINASTSTGLVQSADTSGEIELQSNGTTALKVNTNEGIQILNCLGVGNATPSTSGAGITFPATQSASSDANTLDDYEEGTWTPVISADTPPSSVTYSTQSGFYTRIGNVVYVRFRVTFGFSGGSGSLRITGLPFTAVSGANPKTSVQQDNITYTGYTYLECGASGGGSYIGLGKNRSGATSTGVLIGDCNTTSTDINSGVFYFA